MARRRKYPENYVWGEAHRLAIPELYERVGHRLSMLDRDWTEFCYFCHEPLALVEQVLDRGHNLEDKCSRVTRRLGERANLPAYLIGIRTSVPDEVGTDLRRLREVAPRDLIDGVKVRRLWPSPTQFFSFTPEEIWYEILVLHRDHHAYCPRVVPNHAVTRRAALDAAKAKSRLFVYPQHRLSVDGA